MNRDVYIATRALTHNKVDYEIGQIVPNVTLKLKETGAVVKLINPGENNDMELLLDDSSSGITIFLED